MVIRLTRESSSTSSSNRRNNSRPVIILIVITVFLLFDIKRRNRFITIATSNNNTITYPAYLSAASAPVTNVVDVVAAAIYLKHSVGDQLLDWLDHFTNDGSPGKRHITKCPSPLIYFKNVIVRSRSTSSSSLPETVTTITTTTTKNDTTTTTELIPKILHVSHKSRCLPQDLARRMEMWKHKLPNYSIFFHDDTAVNKLIYTRRHGGQNFPIYIVL